MRISCNVRRHAKNIGYGEIIAFTAAQRRAMLSVRAMLIFASALSILPFHAIADSLHATADAA